MDPGGEDPVFEAILLGIEVAVAAEIYDTRLMGENLRVKRAQLDVKEGELEMRKLKKARLVAPKVGNDKLVTDFLQADNTKDFEKQKTMKDAITNSVNPDVIKFVDAFLDGDTCKNSDDPKAMADALLVLVKPDSCNCNGAGFDVINGEGDKAKNL